MLFPTLEAMTIDKEKLYFAESDSNDIYEFNYVTGEIKKVCVIRDESEYGKRLFGGMALSKDKLLLSPQSAKYAYLIDCSTKKIKRITGIETEMINPTYYEKFKYRDVYTYGDCFYIVGASVPEIVKVTKESVERRFYGFSQEVIRLKKKSDASAIIAKTCICNNIIYAPLGIDNSYVTFNLSSCDYDFHKVDVFDDCFSAACTDGEYLWLASRNGRKLIRNKIGSKKYERIEVDGNHDKRLEFRDMKYYDGHIFLIPFLGNELISIDTADFKSDCVFRGNEPLRMSAACGNGRMIVSSLNLNEIMIFDGYDSYSIIQISFPYDDMKRRFYDLIKKNNTVLESNGVTLKTFCNVISF